MVSSRLHHYLEDTRVAQVAALVERACGSPSNVYSIGIWTHHTLHVADLGLALAPRLGADQEVVVLAALLHDYAAIIHPDRRDDHHTLGAVEARRVLSALGYDADTVATVADCVLCHRGSVPRPRTTPEAECLASADAMAHMLNVPSLLHLAYTQMHMTADEGAAWVSEKLRRSWAKLSDTAREMARERYEAALLTLRPGDSCQE